MSENTMVVDHATVEDRELLDVLLGDVDLGDDLIELDFDPATLTPMASGPTALTMVPGITIMTAVMGCA